MPASWGHVDPTGTETPEAVQTHPPPYPLTCQAVGAAQEAHSPSSSRLLPSSKGRVPFLRPGQHAVYPSLLVHVCAVKSDSVVPCREKPARLLCPWDSPGENTGVGGHYLLQGIFLTQGWNPPLLCLLNWQAAALPLSRLGCPIHHHGQAQRQWW